MVDYLPLLIFLEVISVFLWRYDFKVFSFLCLFLFVFLFLWLFKRSKYLIILFLFFPLLFIYPLPHSFDIGSRRFAGRVVFNTPFYESRHRGYASYKGMGVVIYSQNAPQISIGDSVYVYGILLKNTNDEYDRYLLNSGYPLKVYAFYMKKMGQDKNFLLRIKRKLYDHILSWNVHSITKGLSLALITGDRNYVDERVKGSFVKSGTIHLLAISGLHIGLVFSLLTLLFFYLPVKIRDIVVLFILGMYVMFIDRSSAYRAYLVISFFILSTLLQRDVNPLRVLVVIALFMILLKPYYVVDRGFIFSFMAYGGIIISKNIWKNKPLLLKLLLISLFAQLPLIPLLSSFNGFINVFSLLHNIILIPLLTPLMILIFLSLFLPFLRVVLDMYVLFYTGYIFNVSQFGVVYLHLDTYFIVIGFYLFYLAIFLREYRRILILSGLILWLLHVLVSIKTEERIFLNKSYFSIVRIKGKKAFVIGRNFWSLHILRKSGVKEIYYVDREILFNRREE